MKTLFLLRTIKPLSLLILLMGLLAVVSAGRVMADQPTAVTCGDTISAPGQYYLAADCTGPGITITASDVHLKLDGHTLSGGRFSFFGVAAVNVSSVHIQGPGTITNYDRAGIYFNGVTDSHVEQVTSTSSRGDGFDLISSTNIHVNNNVFTMNSDGVFVATHSTSNHINGNTALGNGVNDLQDDNANCDDNKWNGNNFNTANQSCIH